MHKFRYSRSKFNRGLIVSLGLTAMCTFLVFMMSRIFGVRAVWVITWSAGLIFFAFFPARLLWTYLREDVVLAVRLDGIYDARVGREIIPWEDIWEIDLERLEADWQIVLRLWPNPVVSINAKNTGARDDVIIETAMLEADIEEIVAAIKTYKPVLYRS